MYCSQCASRNDDDARFCNECGTILKQRNNSLPSSLLTPARPQRTTPPVAPAFDTGSAAVQPIVPLPPNLHWGWLLLLSLVTRSLFAIVWAFIQANWARSLSGKNKALVQCAIGAGCDAVGGAAILAGASSEIPALIVFGFLLWIPGCVCVMLSMFSTRRAMVEYYNSVENIGLKLSGVMTLFFSTFYFQYRINRIARWKRTGILS